MANPLQLNIQVNVDDASIKAASDKLSALQSKADGINASGGGSGSGGANKSKKFADAIRDVNRALKQQQVSLIKGNSTLSETISKFKALEGDLKKAKDLKKLNSTESLRLATSQKTLASAIASAEKDILAQEKALESTTKAQEKATAAEELAITTAVKNAKSTDLLAVKIDRLNLELKQTETGFKKGSITADEAQEVYDRLEKEVLQLGEAYELTTKDQLKLSTAQRSVVNANLRAGNGFKSLSGAMNEQKRSTEDLNLKLKNVSNQGLIDLSRGLEDSKQFAFGFNQGMTAIGNNIPQVIESFGRLRAESNKLGGSAMKALIASFTGVGGFLVAVNLAVLALPYLIDLFKDLTGEAKEFDRSINDVSDSFKRLVSEEFEKLAEARIFLGLDENDVLQSQFEIGQRLIKQYDEQLAILSDQFKIDEKKKPLLDKRVEKEKELRELQSDLLNTQRLFAQGEQGRIDKQRSVDRIKEKIALEAKSLKLIEQQISAIDGEAQAFKDANESKIQGIQKAVGELAAEITMRDEIIALANREQKAISRKLKELSEALGLYKNIRDIQEDSLRITQEQQEALSIKTAPQVDDSRVKALQDTEKALQGARLARLQTTLTAEKSFLGFQLNSANLIKEQKLATEERYYARVAELQRQGLDFTQAQQRAEVELARETAEKKFEIAKSGITGLADLTQFLTNVGAIEAKKAFKIQKALSASQATIDGYLIVQKTLKEPALPFPSNVIAAGVMGAAAAARVASILSTPFGGGGGRIGAGGTRTLADGGEGFTRRTMSGSFVAQNTAMTSANTQTAPTIVIESALNQDVLAYNVREGEATIRRNNAVMVSDA